MAVPSGRVIPPLRRIDLTRFKDMVEQIVPEVKVLVPEMFHAYDLGELA